jgi:PAS domain S-box-containing protein
VVLSLLLIGWLGTSWADSPSDRRESGKVIAVIPLDAPPTYFLDKRTNKPAGFAVDVMDAVAKRAGLQVDYIFEEGWTDIIDKVKSGEADLIPGIGSSKERRKDLAFSTPIENVSVSFFARGQGPGLEAPPRIHTVGVIEGSLVIDRLKERADIHLITYESFVQGLFDLLAGKIDALATPVPTTLKLAQDSGIENRIRVVGKPIMEITRTIAVRKNNTVLLGRLNSIIAGFVGSPEYQRIYVKWYGKPTPYWTMGKIVAISAIISILVVGIIAGWRYWSIYTLNREIKSTVVAALRESESKFRSLVETTSDWIWEVDQEGAYTYASPQVGTLLGYKPEEVIGKTPFDFMPSDEANRVRSIFLASVTARKPLIAIENNNLRKDGRIVSLETSGVPIIDIQGNFLGYRGIDRDITDRKQAEEILLTSEKKLRDITSSMGEGLYVLDPDGKVTFMNPEAERLLGWTETELLNRNIHDIIHSRKPDGTVLTSDACQMQFILQTGMRYSSHDEIFIRKDGTFFPASVISSPLMEDGKIIASVTAFRNISDIKQVEQEREKLISELQHALATIKTLHGLLPICSSCKKIRDDEGSWTQLEAYITKHSDAEFTHGICSECAKKLYPGYHLEEDRE